MFCNYNFTNLKKIEIDKLIFLIMPNLVITFVTVFLYLLFILLINYFLFNKMYEISLIYLDQFYNL